jgi:hypothetical protein
MISLKRNHRNQATFVGQVIHLERTPSDHPNALEGQRPNRWLAHLIALLASSIASVCAWRTFAELEADGVACRNDNGLPALTNPAFDPGFRGDSSALLEPS